MSITGHFVASAKGRLFVSQFGNNKSDTAVLCLPSIAEELNLSRAVLAKQCQSYAKSGTDSYIMDYYGTGDSEGEFEEATTNDWLADVLAIGYWLMSIGYKHLVLLGVRAGGLFIGSHQKTLHQQLPIIGQILWKPVTSGKVFISQLIRIKQANQMMNNSAKKTNWRNEILAGNSTEVAGYLLTANFVESMELLAIKPETDWQSSVHWLELASENLTPATKRFTDHLACIDTHALATPPFWQVPEIFELPDLVQLGNEILTSILRK